MKNSADFELKEIKVKNIFLALVAMAVALTGCGSVVRKGELLESNHRFAVEVAKAETAKVCQEGAVMTRMVYTVDRAVSFHAVALVVAGNAIPVDSTFRVVAEADPSAPADAPRVRQRVLTPSGTRFETFATCVQSK